ncbi:lactonase family protein [Klebsiella pneumoniae]
MPPVRSKKAWCRRWRIGDNGTLSELNQVASGGAGPVYLSLTPDGKHLLVANYISGTVAVLPVNADGSLSDATDTHQDKGEPGAANARKLPSRAASPSAITTARMPT